jgi:hypothetical protein
MTYVQRIRKALKWWSHRQSMKFFWEAEKIRDELLQESFAIRRNLALSVRETPTQLQKIDNFHRSLVQLSDRLCPSTIEDSLPLSIESLLDTLIISSSHLHFQIDIPGYWQQESLERSLIILRCLEELFIITIPDSIIPISIYINLKNAGNSGKLVIKITYPDISTLIMYSSLPELKYLQDSFNFLISGKCRYYHQSLSLSYIFFW